MKVYARERAQKKILSSVGEGKKNALLSRYQLHKSYGIYQMNLYKIQVLLHKKLKILEFPFEIGAHFSTFQTKICHLHFVRV